jgi:hypothetical protein
VSYRGIYLLNTLTKLFEGLIEARLSKFTELNDSLTPSQQGSRITRQTHDAIYALIATIQGQSQYGFASYCCFIDFATAYPSVHRERLGLTLKNYNITGKFWHLLGVKENSRSVRVRVRHALIDQKDEVKSSVVSPKAADLALPSLASNEPPDSPPPFTSPLASPSRYPLEPSHSKNPPHSNTWV